MSASSPAESSTDVPPPKQHIKRPPNAWVIYRQVKSKEYREAHPDRKFTLPEMSGIMSKQWAGEPEEEIRRFEQLANEKLSELLKRHPEYRYQPRSRGSGDKQKKIKKVREGRVTKPKRTKKDKAALTATETITEATNVVQERYEANGPITASSGVFGLGPPVLLDDQRALTNANHIFCDNTIYSLDNFNAAMLNCGAQPMAAGSGQIAMQQFPTSQGNAHRLMSNGGTIVSNGQFHIGGSFQPFNASEANTLYPLYEQTTEAAAGPGVPYATTPRNDGSSNCFNSLGYPTPDFMHAAAPLGNEQVSLDATVNSIQGLNAVFENLANFLAFDRDYMAWGV